MPTANQNIIRKSGSVKLFAVNVNSWIQLSKSLKFRERERERGEIGSLSTVLFCLFLLLHLDHWQLFYFVILLFCHLDHCQLFVVLSFCVVAFFS